MGKAVLVALIGLCNIFGGLGQEEGPTVTTSFGQIQGTYLNSRDGNKYAAFLGIPYAKPPKRFQVAEFPEPWKDIKNATDFGSGCPQTLSLFAVKMIVGSEDCLFLNVYTPNTTGEFPVMFFIHGGAFVSGSSNLYGGGYFIDEDVILVTINYRLGALGFLNTGDGEMEGNLGLKDQVLALKWVQDNIKAFGGDPKKVTIFGESAGSSCTHHHMLSPLSKGLFSKAIMQSGTAINSWSYEENPGKPAFALGKALGCNATTSNQLIACLQKADSQEIVKATAKIALWYGDPIVPFPISADVPGKSKQVFISKSPIDTIKSGDYNKVPAIFSACEDEGVLLRAGPILLNQNQTKEINEDYLRILPITLDYHNKGYNSSQLDEISNKIKKFYFGNKEISGNDTFQNLTNMFSDRLFLGGIENAIALHSKDIPVFNGIFTYKGIFSIAKLFGINKNVVTHADDVQYFFSISAFPVIFAPGSKVENASKYFVSLWTNFAKTGNPGAKWTKGVEWLPVDGSTVEKTGVNWWELDFPPKKLENPFKERMQFWRDTL